VRAGSRIRRAEAWSDLLLLALPLWIALVLLRLALDWMYYGLGLRGTPYPAPPFFGGYLATDHGLAVLMVAYAVAALCTAYPVAHPAGRWSALVRITGRLFAVTVAYLLFAGYMWKQELPAVLLVLGGLPVAVLVALPAEWRERLTPERQVRVRAEDPGAAQDLARWGRWFDNAVFIRDLRVALRGGGLRRQFLLNSGGLCLLAGAVGGIGLPFYGMSGAAASIWPPVVYRWATGVMLAGSWLILPAMLAYGGRALANWGTERRCVTLPQVFATPLPTEAFVRGRWLAAVLVGLVRALPVPVAILLALGVVAEAREIPMYVAQGVWLASLGLVLSVGLAGSAQDTSIQLEDLFCSGCLAVYVVMVEGLLYLWLWTQAPLVGGAPDRSGLVLYSWWMTPLNGVVTYLVYWRAVADIALLRRRETE
jgi:hypothetical protein